MTDGLKKIAFDTGGRIDRVTLAVGAVDPVAGFLIRKGVEVRIKGLADRPIVNGSGLFVFINLADRPEYEVEVDGRRAGFPFVEQITFRPPSAANTDPNARRRDVVLAAGPDYPFPPGTTLVRGVVRHGSGVVAEAAIAATPAGGGGTFRTRSAANGAFALALRLPPLGPHEAEAAVPVTIVIEQGGHSRSLVRPVANGRGHSFLEPIDLTGSNEPGFFAA